MKLRIAALAVIWSSAALVAQTTPILQYLTSFRHGPIGRSASEIVDYDPSTRRLFVINSDTDQVDVLSMATPNAVTRIAQISMPAAFAGTPSSVSIYNGIAAVSVIAATTPTNPGYVVFFRTSDNSFISGVTVGSGPDMVTFTPNGNQVLTANEGEPNAGYTIDPEGTVSIIDVSAGVVGLTNARVQTVNFRAFNGTTLDSTIRIFGPRATIAQDLEPEYIAVSADSRRAYVTCQENNAMAEIDLISGTVVRLVGLGFKDHSLPGNALDASDRDTRINIRNWPVLGMYQPDGIAAFTSGGATYLAMANEGDARDYAGFAEESRFSALRLDPVLFPNASSLQEAASLGRLTVSRSTADTDNDGDIDRILAYGSRSFSVRDSAGNLMFDSGDQMERTIARWFPANFNASGDSNDLDNRSDNKGPEPEGVVIGRLGNRNYAFVGLERFGGVMVYDVTAPAQTQFVGYAGNRNFSAAANTPESGDTGVEGLKFISAADSPNGRPLLILANEFSGTTSIYQINMAREITGLVDVVVAGPVLNRTNGRLTYTVTLRNQGSTPIEGAIHVLVTGLAEGALPLNFRGLAGNDPFYTVTPERALAVGGTTSLIVEVAPPAGGSAGAVNFRVWANQ